MPSVSTPSTKNLKFRSRGSGPAAPATAAVRHPSSAAKKIDFFMVFALRSPDPESVAPPATGVVLICRSRVQKIANCPEPIRDPCRHRGRNPQRHMRPHKIIVCEVEGNRRSQVLDLLAVTVG